MAQNPAWTIIRYQSAIWIIVMVFVVAWGDLQPAAGALIAVAGTALTSAVAMRFRQAEQSLTAVDLPERPKSGGVIVSALDASAALETLPKAVLIIARSRDILWANTAASRMFGANPTGKPLLSVLRDPALSDALEEAWRAGQGLQSVGISLGGGRELAVDLAPFGKGGDACALLLLRDVSGEKRLEALRSDFIANVSHELKTPISALLGFIETLQGPAREDREATDRFLSIMRGQSERMDRLVGDLLSLSRIELTEHARPTEIVDLGPVLHSLSDAFAIKLAAKNMRLELPPATVWPKVLGAPDELFQVFQNLIDNAIKYGREGEPISIIIETSRDQAIIRKRLPSLREAQALASISVIDRGAGIAREHLPRLTERFYRVDPARSRDMGGTGLGLAIVKHIVNRHRGSLTITSEPGIGSCFTVHLPVEAQ